MKKRSILLISLAFLGGLIIGILASVVKFGQIGAESMLLLKIKHYADWSERSHQAYREESPEVASWALENYADILENDSGLMGEYSEFSEKDLVLLYARIALVRKAAKDDAGYSEYITKALVLAPEAYEGRLQSEDELLHFVEKLDKIRGKGVDP